MNAKPAATVYDAATKRYRAACPHCIFVAVRAKREAAEWLLSQHLAYSHDDAPGLIGETIQVGADRVPVEDTVCRCGHWHDEHAHGGACVSCAANVNAGDFTSCAGFEADPEQSTPEAIADRGGDPEKWPDHVKRAVAT